MESQSSAAGRTKPMPRRLYRAAVAAMVLAGLGAAFQIYDMACPHTFVGNMYGLIVLMRLAVLGVGLLALLVGGLLTVLGWARRRRGICIAGAVVVFVATVPILGLTAQTAWDRYASTPDPRDESPSPRPSPAGGEGGKPPAPPLQSGPSRGTMAPPGPSGGAKKVPGVFFTSPFCPPPDPEGRKRLLEPFSQKATPC